jgi:hypothetical protein
LQEPWKRTFGHCFILLINQQGLTAAIGKTLRGAIRVWQMAGGERGATRAPLSCLID